MNANPLGGPSGTSCPSIVESRRCLLAEPPLRFLHSTDALSLVKIDAFRKLTTADLVDSLQPGQSGALKTRADGTVLEDTIVC